MIHNSLGCEWLLGLDVTVTVQDVFRPIPGLISCAGVTGSVGVTRHARAAHDFVHVLIFTCMTHSFVTGLKSKHLTFWVVMVTRSPALI